MDRGTLTWARRPTSPVLELRDGNFEFRRQL